MLLLQWWVTKKKRSKHSPKAFHMSHLFGSFSQTHLPQLLSFLLLVGGFNPVEKY